MIFMPAFVQRSIHNIENSMLLKYFYFYGQITDETASIGAFVAMRILSKGDVCRFQNGMKEEVNKSQCWLKLIRKEAAKQIMERRILSDTFMGIR